MPDSQLDSAAFAISTKGGIQRDGTVNDSAYYVDGQWVRFQNGRPRKMGGYKRISNQFAGPIRDLFVDSRNGANSIFSFHENGIEAISVNSMGTGGGITDMTPAGFVGDPNYRWETDSMYSVVGNDPVLVAGAFPDLDAIDQDAAALVYYGSITALSTPLVSTGESVSGGCVSLDPYLFLYGSNGLIKNSIANNPTVYTGGESNEVNVAGTKFVKGMAIRGGTNSPAGLFWALDSLVRVTFVGGTVFWNYDTVSRDTTILSAKSVVEDNGTFYWIGVDKFWMYNGVVQSVPNDMNVNWFFDNVNVSCRQKVWAMRQPRWDEIWWFYPRGDSTECNAAVIFNTKSKIWYDVVLGRSAGFSAQVFTYPIMAGTEANDNDKYTIWMHEFGVDSIEGNEINAIQSYFETNNIGLISGGVLSSQPAGSNVGTRVVRIEPDFASLTGDLNFYANGQQFPDGPSGDILSDPYPYTPGAGYVDIREQRRYLRIRCESNVAGGNYFLGKSMLHVSEGDVRS